MEMMAGRADNAAASGVYGLGRSLRSGGAPPPVLDVRDGDGGGGDGGGGDGGDGDGGTSEQRRCERRLRFGSVSA
ncbi:MAG TPA: hypothetical protein DCL15_01675 [Chloroflexi bacterium]|nr:hypothetical protein [Chloroflexota bacterium]